MLSNPFTPARIAANPQDFFGRSDDIRLMERGLMQGSVAILGAVGIGKSSLLSQVSLLMQGFNSDHKSLVPIVTAHKEITCVDEAARLLLESFATVDESSFRIQFNLGKVVSFENKQICKYFASGRHLNALERIIEKKYLDMALAEKELLILAIDEADKCPVPLARVVRKLSNHLEQTGVTSVRFAMAGVNPYFKRITDEDPGVARFFYRVHTLLPMPPNEAIELVSAKFGQVQSEARKNRIRLVIEPDVIGRVVALSGGHPHILQLLGSHIVEHENDEPDGVIDASDMVNALQSICYRDRAHVYENTLHSIDTHGYLEAFQDLLEIADPGFPTRIKGKTALSTVDRTNVQALVDMNILVPTIDGDYGLIDEFLRVRIYLDAERANIDVAERYVIRMGIADWAGDIGGADSPQTEFGVWYQEQYGADKSLSSKELEESYEDNYGEDDKGDYDDEDEEDNY